MKITPEIRKHNVVDTIVGTGRQMNPLLNTNFFFLFSFSFNISDSLFCSCCCCSINDPLELIYQ